MAALFLWVLDQNIGAKTFGSLMKTDLEVLMPGKLGDQISFLQNLKLLLETQKDDTHSSPANATSSSISLVCTSVLYYVGLVLDTICAHN